MLKQKSTAYFCRSSFEMGPVQQLFWEGGRGVHRRFLASASALVSFTQHLQVASSILVYFILSLLSSMQYVPWAMYLLGVRTKSVHLCVVITGILTVTSASLLQSSKLQSSCLSSAPANQPARQSWLIFNSTFFISAISAKTWRLKFK